MIFLLLFALDTKKASVHTFDQKILLDEKVVNLVKNGYVEGVGSLFSAGGIFMFLAVFCENTD